MAPRRPAPLSDELFGPTLLGSAQPGMVMAVKNTFVHVPSGTTPQSAKVGKNTSLLTAPANLIGRLAWPNLFGDTPTSPSFPDQSGDPAEPGPTSDITPSTLTQTSPIKEDDLDDADSVSSEDLPPCFTTLPTRSAAELAPKPPPGALHPSVGSSGHVEGLCRRCCFFPRGRCVNGYNCEFCHYQHDRRKRKNRSKKRNMRPWMHSMHSTHSGEHHRIQASLPPPVPQAPQPTPAVSCPLKLVL